MSTMDGRARPEGAWVVIRRPQPAARLRLFCFPYAGAGASVYYGWPAALPAQVEVAAVQPPGRETRVAEPPVGDAMALVDRMYAALLPFMDRPFAFFGHSAGALLAFLLARRLRAEGRPGPLHLFVSGRMAPHLPLPEPHVHTLADPELMEVLRHFGGTPEEILQHEEVMQLVMPIVRADFSLGETYVHRDEPPLAVPMSAYGGREDPLATEETVRAWGEHTSAAFKLRMFDGDHFFLNARRAEVLDDVTRELRGVLDTVPADA